MTKFYFKCIVCEKEFDKDEVTYTCPSCNNNLEVIYDYKKNLLSQFIKSNKNFTIWNYLPLLPVEQDSVITKIQVYKTPLLKSINLGPQLGLKNLFFKDETKLPSGSLKDRASAIVVAYGLQNKKEKFITASTGNAGCALACISAMVAVKSRIVVPKTAPKAKLLQIKVYGAEIFPYDGNYDDCFDYVLNLCNEDKTWFNRSTGVNPFTREGKKTVSFEIWEQLGFKPPDIVFVPIGDGNIISGVWKGFRELFNCKEISSLPKIIGVQSKNSNSVSLTLKKIEQKYYSPKNKKLSQPISKIFRETKVVPVKSNTTADSISVDYPRDAYAAIKSIIESNGFIIEVSDEEIIEAIKLLAENEGILAEPAGATSFAGLKKFCTYCKELSDKVVVTLVTGHGLKDISVLQEI